MNTQAFNTDTFVCALDDSFYFTREFVYKRSLGSGADGDVHAWEHEPTSRIIAIKVPRQSSSVAKENIKHEAGILTRLR